MKFYNDSISTAPESATRAVSFFGKDLAYLLLGGQSGGGNFDILISRLLNIKFEGKVLITKSPILELFKKSAKKLGFNRYEVVKDFKEALKIVFSQPQENKICLLSPAGKSFDQYNNYIERGNHFREMVEVL